MRSHGTEISASGYSCEPKLSISSKSLGPLRRSKFQAILGVRSIYWSILSIFSICNVSRAHFPIFGIWNFFLRFETSFSVLKLHVRFWNFILRFETSFYVLKLHFLFWNFIFRFETSFLFSGAYKNVLVRLPEYKNVIVFFPEYKNVIVWQRISWRHMTSSLLFRRF
jgi:hypothetical protein